jgi:hypothetical protein
MDIDAIFFVIFFIAILTSFYYYDKILKIEYSNYREQWIKDGSPLGFFWVPKGAKLFAGSFSRGSLSFRWLFKNPPWAINDNAVHGHLLKLRVGCAVGAITWLIAVIVLLMKK